jgi:heterotetrameric sarcosine oxidase delta subunit
MMIIPCPWCGSRGEDEFVFGGEPALRPVPAAEVTDQAWATYLYFRANEKGAHREIWHHAKGCGQWFSLLRDTVSHQVLSDPPNKSAGP